MRAVYAQEAAPDRGALHDAGIQLFDNGDRVSRHTTPFLELYVGTDQNKQNRLGGALGYRIRWDLSLSAVLEKQTMSFGQDFIFMHAMLDYLIRYNRPLIIGVGFGPSMTVSGTRPSYGAMARMTFRYYLFSGFALQAEGAGRYLTGGLDQQAVLASAGLHIDL